MMSQPGKALMGVIIAVVLLAASGLIYALLATQGPSPLVVYCAHDSVFADDVLRKFEEETGIPVHVRYDTEATKSLGLVELILRERNNPRCDVFWNNQVLGTTQLQEAGLLEAYKGPGYQRIPDAYKDPGGQWCGFAARLRVYIVNTEKMEANPQAIAERLAGSDLSRVAIAKPLYGTTLTHYSLLWELWGGDELKRWHTDWRKRGVREVGGNAQVKDVVADGTCDFGLTDTDDAFAARDEGKPVAMLPVRVAVTRVTTPVPHPEPAATIAIPNTVSIIKGTPRLTDARRLVDYLLSAQGEMMLAGSKSRQVPLGEVDEAQLPDDVRELKAWAKDGYPIHGLSPSHRECLAWLKAEYVP